MEEEQIGLRQDLEEAQTASTAVEEDLVDTQVHVTYTVQGLISTMCACVMLFIPFSVELSFSFVLICTKLKWLINFLSSTTMSKWLLLTFPLLNTSAKAT